MVMRSRQRGDDYCASFVVRIWFERGGDAPAEWRWHAIHVQSGHKRYGRAFEDLQVFVARESGLSPPTLGVID